MKKSITLFSSALAIALLIMGCSPASPEKICERADGFDGCKAQLEATQKALDADNWKTLSGCLEKQDKITQKAVDGCLDDKMREKLGDAAKKKKAGAPETEAAPKSEG